MTNDPVKLVMLGAAPGTRGGTSSAVEAYRADGLFRRWPSEYVATFSDGGPAENAALAWHATRRLGVLLGRSPRAVVHAHVAPREGLWRQCAFVGAALALRRPVVTQLHGGGYEAWFDACSTPARATIGSVLARSACVIVPCESLQAWVRSVTRAAPVALVPHPVAMPATAAPLAGRPNVVLFLGRLEREKGILDLLDAVAAVRAAVPDLRLVCAGGGDREPIERHAETLGIRDAVKFVGWVGPSGKRALLESATVYALPSYCDGLPASLLEAMAAGVPVVASAVGGIPEAVVDGASGFLIAPGDSAALARHLRRLLLDRTLAARVGAAARETVRARYAADRAVAQLEEVYRAVGGAAERPSPPVEMRKAA